MVRAMLDYNIKVFRIELHISIGGRNGKMPCGTCSRLGYNQEELTTLKRMKSGLLALALATSPALSGAAPSEPLLPTIGDTTSATISLQQERVLGQTWARMLRGQAPLLDDPLVYHYLDDLLWSMVANSQLQDRQLELITVDNGTLNAFAVPGGIVGVHGGLLLAAEREDELASVLAHELAHLSQRHFAQQLEEQRRNRPLMLAAMLGSILIAAADSKAGAAAITSTMAGNASAQLAFSRRNEQEADRIGMLTLKESGFDPKAMPRMFARMQQSMRFYGDKPPEFLLTHPVTESRIADSANRAAQYPASRYRKSSNDFDIIRARILLHYSDNPARSLEEYAAAAKRTGLNKHKYAAMLAAVKTHKYQQATSFYNALSKNYKHNLYVRISHAELLIAQDKTEAGLKELSELNKLYPGNLAIEKSYARALFNNDQIEAAITQYKSVTERYPNDVDSWYYLAESYGKIENISALHDARIEYFLLTGNLDRARQQVTFAMRERGLTQLNRARLEERRREIDEIRSQMEMDF